MRTATLLVLGTVAAAATLAGCAGGTGDKAGASSTHPTTLVMEAPDQGDPQADVFAKAVAVRSHGKLVVRIDPASTYSSAVPANEARLARALEEGTVDLGYVPARAWSVEALPDFQALQAPFVVSTGTAARALSQSPLAKQVLAMLPSSLVGLALVPEQTRRVLASHPVDTLDGLSGLRIRVVDDPQAAADLRALGAQPRQGITSGQTGNMLLQGALDAVESAPRQILENSYLTSVTNLSSYSPYAKFEVVVLSASAWKRLTVAQRAVLRSAAADAVADAVRADAKGEQADLSELCEAHVLVSRPTRAAFSAIVAKERPVLARLSARPGVARLLDAMRALPGAGPQRDASALPPACTGSGGGLPKPAPSATPFPKGVFTVTDSPQDFLNGNVHSGNADFDKPITYVTTMRDGTWYQTQSPNYPDQGPFSGTYSVNGDQVTFVMKKAGKHGENEITAPETVTWSYFDGQLHFQIVDVADTGSRVLYTAHPWRKLR